MLKIVMATMLATQATIPPAVSPAEGARCITRAEASSLGVVGPAMFIGVVQNVCRSHLGPGAFLTSAAGNAYVANLRAEGLRQLPTVMAGMTRVAPGPAGSPTIMRGVFQSMLGDDAGGEWAPMADADMCRDADALIEAMSVMTPERLARFTGALIGLADRFSQMIPPRSVGLAPTPPPAPPPASGARPRPLFYAPPQVRNERPPVPVYIAPAPRSGESLRRRPPPVLCPESR
jgi:hypothetical protein